MDECQWTGTVGEVLDSQVNGYDGTAMNGATTAAGKLCNSGVFDGNSSYVSVSNSNFGFGSEMSVAAWVKWDIAPSSGQNYANIISINSTSQTDTGQFWLQHDNNNQHFQFSVTTTNSRYFVNSTTSPVQGIWYHVVGVYDRNVIHIYVDGQQEANQSTGGNADIAAYDASYALDIGRWAYSGFPRAFAGQIDEAKVYTRRLRGNQILNLYNRESSGNNYDNSTRSCPTCQALAEWRMDECFWGGIAGEVVDSSNHGHDGTAQGSAATSDSDPELCRDGELIGSSYLSLATGITLGSSWTATMWVRFPLDSSSHTTVGGYGNVYVVGSINGTGDMALLYDSGGTNLRWMVYDNIGSVANTDFPDNLTGWHHLTFVGRSSGSTDLYLDGAFHSTVARRTTGNVTYIATSSDDPAGQTMGAALDEYKIFNSELTNAQITQIYNNESAGNNWNGSARQCPSCLPIAEYHLDECYWDGTAGEVKDSSGNGNNGTAQGNAGTVAGGIICRSAEFNSGGATGQYVTLPASVADGLRDFTFNTWVKPEDSASHTFISAANSGNDNAMLLYVNNATVISTYLNGTTNTYSVPNLADGSWHMVTWTRKSGTENLYVDGLTAGSNPTDGSAVTVQSLILGQDQDSVGGGFQPTDALRGQQDEITFWERALISSEVSTIYSYENGGLNLDGTSRTCPTCILITYYEIIHDGSATVCYPEAIQIVARDSSGGVVTGFTGTIALSTSTGNGTWYAAYPGLTNTDPPQGTFADATADDGQATYTFAAGDLGTVTFFLRDTHAETLQITASDGTYTSAGHNSGNLVFRPSGFAIKDAGGADIPNQVSGHPFTVTVTAIGQDPQSGQCAALDYSGNKTIDAILFYNSPASGSTPLILDGNNIPSTGTSIQLNFVNSVATVSANYNDAGQIWFRLTDNAESITGDSAMFVVKPWSYYVFADGNPGATDASGNVFLPAGDPFTLHVQAVCWDSADDTDNNLIPDAGADLSNNTITGNYNSPVTVTHTLTAPAGGTAGNLTGIPAAISGGQITSVGAAYNEVGIITVTSNTPNYLGAGAVTGTSGTIGRFTPKYIDIPALVQNPACNAGATPFTYAEEPFAIDTTLSAKNMGGTITTNYTGAFAKLVPANLSLTVQTGTGSLTAGTITFTFVNGTALFTIPGNRYGWGAAHDPEIVTLNLSGADSDSVPVAIDSAGTAAVSNGVPYRYGRLQVLDNFSPSTRDLTLTISAQYYSGGDYVPNADDSCTTYLQSNITLQNWRGIHHRNRWKRLRHPQCPRSEQRRHGGHHPQCPRVVHL